MKVGAKVKLAKSTMLLAVAGARLKRILSVNVRRGLSKVARVIRPYFGYNRILQLQLIILAVSGAGGGSGGGGGGGTIGERLANMITQSLPGLKTLGVVIAAAMFAVGAILAVIYVTSRGLRERAKELIEGAIILCIIMGAGALILQFAADIGKAIGGEKGTKVEALNPWQ